MRLLHTCTAHSAMPGRLDTCPCLGLSQLDVSSMETHGLEEIPFPATHLRDPPGGNRIPGGLCLFCTDLGREDAWKGGVHPRPPGLTQPMNAGSGFALVATPFLSPWARHHSETFKFQPGRESPRRNMAGLVGCPQTAIPAGRESLQRADGRPFLRPPWTHRGCEGSVPASLPSPGWAGLGATPPLPSPSALPTEEPPCPSSQLARPHKHKHPRGPAW